MANRTDVLAKSVHGTNPQVPDRERDARPPRSRALHIVAVCASRARLWPRGARDAPSPPAKPPLPPAPTAEPGRVHHQAEDL